MVYNQRCFRSVLIEETEAKIRVNRKYLTISKYSASDRYRNIAAIIQMGAQEFKQSLNTVFKCDELCFFFLLKSESCRSNILKEMILIQQNHIDDIIASYCFT